MSPPQLALTTPWHLGADRWWDGRGAPTVTSGCDLLQDMLGWLPPRAVLVGDAGFVGFDLFEEFNRGVAFLVRVGTNVELLTGLGVHLREAADTNYLWPGKARTRRPVVLRRPVVGPAKRRVHLLTNVLDRRALPKRLAADVYRRRPTWRRWN